MPEYDVTFHEVQAEALKFALWKQAVISLG